MAITTFLPFVDCQKLGARFSDALTAVAALTDVLLELDPIDRNTWSSSTIFVFRPSCFIRDRERKMTSLDRRNRRQGKNECSRHGTRCREMAVLKL
jgi:hypothetical protein